MQNVDRLIRLLDAAKEQQWVFLYAQDLLESLGGGGLVNPRVDLHSMFSESKNNRFSP